MTRRAAPSRPSRGSAHDPYGIGNLAPFMAPLLSLVGLGVVAVATVFALTGQVPFLGSPGVSGGNTYVPAGRTPSASAPPQVNPRSRSRAHSSTSRRATCRSRPGTRPASSRTRAATGADLVARRQLGLLHRDARDKGPLPGRRCCEELRPPVPDPVPDPPRRDRPRGGPVRPLQERARRRLHLVLVHPRPRGLARRHAGGRGLDGPDPTKSDVVLQFVDLRTKQLTNAGLPEYPPLGQQDPAWRADGRYVLYVLNARNGSAGAPAIWRYDTTTKTATAFTSAGYTGPEWSPNGRYVGAVRTTSLGTDVVILDAKGTEIAHVTTDGRRGGPPGRRMGRSSRSCGSRHDRRPPARHAPSARRTATSRW